MGLESTMGLLRRAVAAATPETTDNRQKQNDRDYKTVFQLTTTPASTQASGTITVNSLIVANPLATVKKNKKFKQLSS